MVDKQKPTALMSYARLDDKYGCLTEFRERLGTLKFMCRLEKSF